MRKYIWLLALLLLTSPAFADWTGKDASGATVTFKNVNTCTSVVCVPIAQPVDSAGAAFFVTGNPGFVSPASGATFPVSAAALPLPAGAATSANQATEITSLGTIATNSGTQATATNQATGNASLATIATNSGLASTLAAAATGGCTPGHLLSAASNNSTAVKAGAAGTLCELSILQTTTTLMDVRLYDSAAAPTCSSSTGVVANYVVQSNAVSPGMTIPLGPFGKAFVNGIGICITGANADNDNTNAVAGLNVNYSFK